MRRTLLLAAVAAAVSLSSGAAEAAEVCYNGGGGCVYNSGGYWCWWERAGNGNEIEYCVGLTGVRQCVKTHSGTTCYDVTPPLRLGDPTTQ